MPQKKQKIKRPMSKNTRIRRSAENVIIGCLIMIIAISGWKIISILRNYSNSQNVYEKIAEEVQPQGFTGDIDFDALRKINPDVEAWLYYEGTLIDYPVVQGTDNDKYLHTMFDGSYGDFGTLFVDAVTEEPFRQFNTIIYGHHMRNGSMFGELKKLKDENYCYDHPQLELITPGGKYHLEIWAFLNQPADSTVYLTNMHNEDERAEYIETIREIANYTTGIEITPEDRLVVLSTCAYEYQDARYMVIGKMVPWEKDSL